MSQPLPIVLAITGASGVVYGRRLLEVLLQMNETVHLSISDSGRHVLQHELGIEINLNRFEVQQLLPDWPRDAAQPIYHHYKDFMTPIASGSFRTLGMVILPASMGTVGRIASGVALDLIERAADVHLKEARPLVIAPRELPWNLVHLRNLTTLAEAGARIAPPVPAWYHRPTTIEDMVDFLVIRVFDGLGYDLGALHRWSGPVQPQTQTR